MKDEWWYALDGARKGPVKFEVLRGKVFDGSLSATDLVWTAGMSKWTAISDVPALQEFLQALPPELPKTAAPRPPEPFAATEPTPLVASVPTPELAGPWRRLCARLIDLWVIGLPTVFLVAFFLAPVWPGFALWLQQPRADIALGIFSIPLVLVVESVIFGVFGTTLGKWLLGVHIETLTSRQLWFMDYLFRQTGVYWYGLGVGFPVVNLFTMAWQYGRLKSDRAASYDEGLYKATSRKVSVIRYVFAVLLIFVMIILNGVFDLLNRSYYQKNAASNTHSPVSIEQQPIVNTPQPPVVNSTGDASQTDSEHEKQVREHFNTILVAHPDFRTIAQTDAFKHWVSNSPERRRVSETGTTNEVVRLLHEYKNYSRQTGNNAFEHRKQLTEAERARNEAAYEALARRN